MVRGSEIERESVREKGKWIEKEGERKGNGQRKKGREREMDR